MLSHQLRQTPLIKPNANAVRIDWARAPRRLLWCVPFIGAQKKEICRGFKMVAWNSSEFPNGRNALGHGIQGNFTYYVGQYVEIPTGGSQWTSGSSTAQFTYECIMQFGSFPNTFSVDGNATNQPHAVSNLFFVTDDLTSTDKFLQFEYSSGAGTLNFDAFDGATKRVSTTYTGTNSLQHIIVTSDGTNLKIYIRNMLSGKITTGSAACGFTYAAFTPVARFYIGAKEYGHGFIAFAQFADVAMTQNEIMQRFFNPFEHLVPASSQIDVMGTLAAAQIPYFDYISGSEIVRRRVPIGY